MTIEEAIQEFEDEANHHNLHLIISDKAKAQALCAMYTVRAQPERKHSIAEVIAGLRDLARDRECFFTGGGDDEAFRHDYAVCMEAARMLEKGRGNAG